MTSKEIDLLINHKVYKKIEEVFDEMAEELELDSGDMPPMLYGLMLNHCEELIDIIGRWAKSNYTFIKEEQK